MGTHPIFESDFDCLTDMETESLATIESNAEPNEKPAPRRSTRKKMNKPIVNVRMTPMGLPKPTRLSKTADVSVEDLYLQKDYRTPKTTSALQTIFDENDAKRKKGMLMSKATRNGKLSLKRIHHCEKCGNEKAQ